MFAALPLYLRKGPAFPADYQISLRLRRRSEAYPLNSLGDLPVKQSFTANRRAPPENGLSD